MHDQTETVSIGRLPAITWYWLKSNDIQTECLTDTARLEITASVPEGAVFGNEEENQSARPTAEEAEAVSSAVEEAEVFSPAAGEAEVFSPAAGEAEAVMERLTGKQRVAQTVLTAKKGKKIPLPVQMTIRGESRDSAGAIRIQAQAGSQMTIIMDMTGMTGEPAEADRKGEVRKGEARKEALNEEARKEKNRSRQALLIRIQAEEGSDLKLVQIVNPGESRKLVSLLRGDVADHANLEILQILAGEGEILQDCRIRLSGYAGNLRIHTAYTVGGQDSLDLNYVAEHTGKKTRSEMKVRGVLRENASKIFRGTIDFRKGAAGAVGNETEDVLLLDDTVTNRTVPLILCEEEDVAGDHGATIGRPDSALLFYMQSRGISEKQAEELLAQARLDAVLQEMPEEAREIWNKREI